MIAKLIKKEEKAERTRDRVEEEERRKEKMRKKIVVIE